MHQFYEKKMLEILVLLKKTKKDTKNDVLETVGVARLERATACTPCKNASQLHHTPIALAAAKIEMFFEL